jgi:hypothetical protein
MRDMGDLWMQLTLSAQPARGGARFPTAFPAKRQLGQRIRKRLARGRQDLLGRNYRWTLIILNAKNKRYAEECSRRDCEAETG